MVKFYGFNINDLATGYYDSYSPSIHRPSMWVPGGIVNKILLTALLEYFSASDLSNNHFSRRIQTMLHPTGILHDDLYQTFSVGHSCFCSLFRFHFPRRILLTLRVHLGHAFVVTTDQKQIT